MRLAESKKLFDFLQWQINKVTGISEKAENSQ